MAIPVFVTVLAGILGVGTVLVIAFWPQIIMWARDSLLPWVKRNLPEFAGYVEKAFLRLDDAITSVRRAIKAAWEKVRQWLLKETLEIRQKSSSTFVRKVTSWIVKQVEGKPKFLKVNSEEELSWDELPDEVREEFLRRGKMKPIDVTEIRDRELSELVH